MDVLRFALKRALVTGAGRGIGRGVAVKLAECGAEVVAVSRTKADLDQLTKINNKITPLCVDLGNWKATKEALQNIGKIDLLVNNAATIGPFYYGDLNENEVDEVFNINVKAIVNITQIITNGMKSRGHGGSIVNVSSICGFRAGSSNGVYASSKGAVDQLTRSMAVEYGPHKIRVNSVNPFAVRTSMSEEFLNDESEFAKVFKGKVPLRRFGEVDDVVYPVLFLLSEKASLITGVTLPIDGGLTATF